MNTWVLIIFIGINGWGKYEANSLTSVPGFANKQECISAGEQSKNLAFSNTQTVKYICVEQNHKAQ